MNRRDNDMRGDGDVCVAEQDEAQGAPAVWRETIGRVKPIVGEEDFGKWIADLRLVAELDGEALVAARDDFACDRVTQTFLSDLKRIWAGVDPKRRRLRLVAWKAVPEDVRALTPYPWTDAPAPGVATTETSAAAPPVNETQTFETLVVGESNARAVSIIKRIADGGAAMAQIIFIVGNQGVGKSHLLFAMFAELVRRGDARNVTYMQAEEFLSAYVAGAKAGDTADLKARIRNSDLVVIDDLQTIKGKEKTEREFIANIKSVTAAGGRVILTADEAPGDLQGLSSRLRNALKGAACAEIELPDEAMRARILKTHAALIQKTDPGFALTDELSAHILRRVRGPGRDLCGVLWSLQIESEFGEKDITMDMVERVIRRSEGDLEKPTIDLIKRATVGCFSITKANLEGASKAQVYCYPRQIAMYLARTLTGQSFPAIAKRFGDRDHTTVLHGFRKITKQLAKNPDVVRDVSRVSDAIYELQMTGAR